MNALQRILAIFAELLTASEDDAATLNAELTDLWPQLEDAELAEAEAELLAMFESIRAGEIEDVAATNVAALRVVTTAVESIRALAHERMTTAEAIEAEIAELEAALASTPDAPAGDEPVVEPAAADEPVVEPEPAPEPVLEAVTAASRPPLGQATSRQPVTARPRTPAPAPADPHVTIVATNGGVLDSMTAAAEVISRGYEEMGPNAGKRSLVTIRADYPEELTLRQTDTQHNRGVMDAIVAAGADPASWEGRDALTAAGWCAPSPVDYGLVINSIADRPVWSSLPKVGMDRMGIRLPISPTLSDVDVFPTANSAVSPFTEDDVDDGAFTKPIQAIDCPSFEDFRAYAIVKRLKYKNGAAMAYPENVAAWNDLAGAAWARLADGMLLGQIRNDAGTSIITEPDQTFGAALDIVELILRLTTGMRSADRTRDDARIRSVIPSWVVNLMQADMMRSGRSSYTDADLVMAKARIVSALDSAGVNATFTIDTPLTLGGVLSGPSQILPRETNGQPANDWPCQVQFGLWFEGHFAVGDPGELSIGVVRDSALNERNEFESFYEKYEGLVAHRGPQALWVTQTVLASGEFAAPVTSDVTCAS